MAHLEQETIPNSWLMSRISTYLNKLCELFGLLAEVKGYLETNEVYERTSPDPINKQSVLITTGDIPMMVFGFFGSACFYRIIELFRLERIFKIIESNH